VQVSKFHAFKKILHSPSGFKADEVAQVLFKELGN
jgi:hypothetical protein